MISDPNNIALLRQWLAYYREPEYTATYIQVLHYAMANYDDSQINEAVAHVQRVYGGAPQQQQAQQVVAPNGEYYTVYGVQVELQSRAFRHIPPGLWDELRALVQTGSLAKKIEAAGAGIHDWYEVLSTSDETFSFGSQDASICTCASWSSGTLVVYHAHPDLHAYDTYF